MAKPINFTIFVALLLMGACNNEQFSSVANEDEQVKTPPAASDQVLAESDSKTITADIPVPISGAYMSCFENGRSDDGLSAIVGCRIEQNGYVVDDVKRHSLNIEWKNNVEGTFVDVISMPVTEDDGFLSKFNISADSEAVLTQIDFEVNFYYVDNVYTFATSTTVVWNMDCALPPISFESIGGNVPVAGTPIANQFIESHQVTFSTLSGNPVLLAGYGVDLPVAYYGGPDNTANYLASNQNTGKFFVTDGHKQAASTDTLVISYLKPAKEASVDLIDIDFSESYSVSAYNSADELIDEVEIQSPVDNYRDGQTTKFVVRSPNGADDIHKLHIVGNASPNTTGIGFGIDNFSPRCSR